MLEFARIPLTNAEQGVHTVLKAQGLSVPLPLEKVDLGVEQLKSYPIIKLSTWVKHLLDTNRFTRQMVGVPSFKKMHEVLSEFWKRFQALKPDHPVFSLAAQNKVKLRQCVPFFSHTDEGRSLKHLPLLVISAHGCLGRGTRSYLSRKKHQQPLRSNSMGLNFTGATFSTNFMFTAMLRPTSDEFPEALECLYQMFADDCKQLMEKGVVSTDLKRKVWMIHVNTKGDLPALIRLGNFKRTFRHVAKAASSKKACRGVCHLCLAGQEKDEQAQLEALPFEDVGIDAAWIPTIGQVLPWNEEPTILKGLDLTDSDKMSFFATDMWHNLHLGVAKHYIASALVCIVESDLLPNGSVEVKMSHLTGLYRDWFKERRERPFVPEISRDTLNFPQSSASPVGKWSKGAASTQMMMFLDWFGRTYITGKTDDNVLVLVVSLVVVERQLFCLNCLLGLSTPHH